MARTAVLNIPTSRLDSPHKVVIRKTNGEVIDLNVLAEIRYEEDVYVLVELTHQGIPVHQAFRRVGMVGVGMIDSDHLYNIVHLKLEELVR